MSEEIKVESLSEMDDWFKGEFTQPANIQMPGTPQEPQVITKEFEIGGQTVKFEGKSIEEVYDTAWKAQNEFMRQTIMEPSTEDTLPPLPEHKEVAPPTDDELTAAMLNFDTDPFNTLNKLDEWRYGVPFEQLKQDIQLARDLRDSLYIDKVETAFVNKNKDFYVCPENADMIYKYLDSRNMQPTLANYDSAFNSLKAINALKKAPVTAQEAKETVSTAMSGDHSSAPPIVEQSDYEKTLKHAATFKTADEYRRWLDSRPRR